MSAINPNIRTAQVGADAPPAAPSTPAAPAASPGTSSSSGSFGGPAAMRPDMAGSMLADSLSGRKAPGAAGSSGAARKLPSERDLKDKVKDKLVSVALKEITTERKLDLASVPLGERGRLGIRAFEKVILPSDPIVAGDPHRSAYSASLGDKRHVFVRSGGVLEAGAGFSASAPIGGGATASAGFSTNGLLEYSVLAPYETKASGALELGRDLTTDLPITAKNAQELPRGAEFSVRGSGTVSASASVGVGASAGAGPLTVGVSGGPSRARSVSGEITLNVKRLDGDKVFVRIGESASASSSASLGVRAGVTLDTAALPKVDLGSGKIADFIEGTATKEVKKQVEKLLSAQASASASSSRASREVESYVLDLSTAEGRGAYESLVKLDTGPAAKLAAEGKATRAVLDESTASSSRNVNASIGPAKLLLIDSLRQDRTGKLEGTNGEVEQARSLFKRSTSGLLSGERSVTWEGVSIQRPGGKPETFFHLTLDDKDRATSKGDVKSFERLASALDADLATQTKGKRQQGLARVFDGAYGDSTLKLDVYYTRDGLKKLAGAPEDQVLATFATAAQKIDGAEKPPAWSVPSQAAAARAAIEEYDRTTAGAPRSEGGGDERQRLAFDYRRTFGRDIEDDKDDLEAAEDLATRLASMRGKPEAEWVKVFADLGQEARFDLSKRAAALNAIAGPSETLVNELSLKGKKLDLTARSEGALANADAEIGKALAPP